MTTDNPMQPPPWPPLQGFRELRLLVAVPELILRVAQTSSPVVTQNPDPTQQ